MCDRKKKQCKYGRDCYRKSREHLASYSHSFGEGHEEEGEPNTLSPKDGTRKRQATLQETLLSKKSLNTSQPNGEKMADTTGALTDDDDTISGMSKFIEDYFLVRMPPDFFDVWKLTKALSSENRQDVFMAAKGAQLVGPFDVLAGKFDKKVTDELEAEAYHLHWRYSSDLPEIQTLISYANGHYAYWRDEPLGDCIVVHIPGTTEDDFAAFPRYEIVGDNLFAALIHLLESMSGSKGKVEELREKVERAAECGRYEIGEKSAGVERRRGKMVARTLHGAGIVVPVKGDVGYRPLSEKDGPLRKIIETIGTTDDDALRKVKQDKLQEIISYVHFANDEGDFGTGLELGHDLFVSNYEKMDRAASQMLSVAYSLLDRQAFTTILYALMKNRRRKHLTILQSIIC